MKKIIALSVVLLTLLAFVGCSSQETEVNVTISEIMEAVKNQMADDMKAGGMPEDNFKDGKLPGYMEVDLTGEESQSQIMELFNSEDIEEGVVLQQMINIKSDLIIVVKAKDETKVEGVKESLNKVKEQQENIWSKYLPDQYEKVKNNVIKTNGNYVIYITYDNPESIEEKFESSLNE